MLKCQSNLVAYFACASLVLAGSVGSAAADKVNYSGKYSIQERKSSGSDAALDVVQNDDTIVVTRIEQGKRTTNHYPLNGSEGDYASPGGVPGKCKAQFKGKYLILESVVVARLVSTAPAMRIHTKERWELSPDSKTLTIKTEEDFPDAPGDVSAIVGQYGSGTQKYARNQTP
jgi:hypothetical protein